MKLLWLRLTTRYLLSRKKQESVVFVKKECTKRPTKKMFSDTFDHKLTDTKEDSVKQEDGGL